jgi:hypothetical protein
MPGPAHGYIGKDDPRRKEWESLQGTSAGGDYTVTPTAQPSTSVVESGYAGSSGSTSTSKAPTQTATSKLKKQRKAEEPKTKKEAKPKTVSLAESIAKASKPDPLLRNRVTPSAKKTQRQEFKSIGKKNRREAAFRKAGRTSGGLLDQGTGDRLVNFAEGLSMFIPVAGAPIKAARAGSAIGPAIAKAGARVAAKVGLTEATEQEKLAKIVAKAINEGPKKRGKATRLGPATNRWIERKRMERPYRRVGDDRHTIADLPDPWRMYGGHLEDYAVKERVRELYLPQFKHQPDPTGHGPATDWQTTWKPYGYEKVEKKYEDAIKRTRTKLRNFREEVGSTEHDQWAYGDDVSDDTREWLDSNESEILWESYDNLLRGAEEDIQKLVKKNKRVDKGLDILTKVQGPLGYPGHTKGGAMPKVQRQRLEAGAVSAGASGIWEQFAGDYADASPQSVEEKLLEMARAKKMLAASF